MNFDVNDNKITRLFPLQLQLSYLQLKITAIITYTPLYLSIYLLQGQKYGSNFKYTLINMITFLLFLEFQYILIYYKLSIMLALFYKSN